jgi:hypothetical protein
MVLISLTLWNTFSYKAANAIWNVKFSDSHPKAEGPINALTHCCRGGMAISLLLWLNCDFPDLRV